MNTQNEHPLISVIVPVYNAERHLPECLDSIICQTLYNIEVILIDDGSTDASTLICRQYAENDSRICFLSQTNGGAASARNHGLCHAAGEFIAFMDADDWYPNYTVLELLYHRATANGVRICGGSLERYDNGTVIEEYL